MPIKKAVKQAAYNILSLFIRFDYLNAAEEITNIKHLLIWQLQLRETSVTLFISYFFIFSLPDLPLPP
jgi:hypothetical protein